MVVRPGKEPPPSTKSSKQATPTNPLGGSGPRRRQQRVFACSSCATRVNRLVRRFSRVATALPKPRLVMSVSLSAKVRNPNARPGGLQLDPQRVAERLDCHFEAL